MIEAEQFRGIQAAVTGEDVAVFIHHDRHNESKFANTVGDLPNLVGRMRTGVAGIALQYFGSNCLHLHSARLQNITDAHCGALRKGRNITEREIYEFCAPLVPRYAVPRFIEIYAELPKTPTNKVQKAELRKHGIREQTWTAPAQERQRKTKTA